MKHAIITFTLLPIYFLLANPNGELDDELFDPEWILVWNDEFDSTNIDLSNWSYDIGTGDWGWGNNEQQYYTSNSNNSFIEDGKLVIQALLQNYGSSNYTSARMVTKNKGDWTYGRIEVRAKLPTGVGTWPAIWMLPTDNVYGGWPYSGEMDIMEHVGFEQNIVHGTAHTETYNWWNGSPPPGGLIYVYNASTDYRNYILEWDENYLKWYVDDMHYFTYNNNQSGYSTWPFDQRFHLILNIAIGGTWGGQQGIDDSIFPVRLEVDYVRVYQLSSQLSSDTEIIPNTFFLNQNFPNPFNPSTQIQYDLPQDEFVTITIYDLMGQKIKELVNEKQQTGRRLVRWDSTNDYGLPVSAGVYLYTIKAGDFVDTKKMVFLK